MRNIREVKCKAIDTQEMIRRTKKKFCCDSIETKYGPDILKSKDCETRKLLTSR